jgi:hypothetical protein
MLRGVQELMCNTAIGPGRRGGRGWETRAGWGQSRNRVDGIITTFFLHVGFQ